MQPLQRLSLRVSAVDPLSVFFPVPAMIAAGGFCFGVQLLADVRGDTKRLVTGLLVVLVAVASCLALYGMTYKVVVFDRSAKKVTVSRFWIPLVTFPLSELQRLEYTESSENSDGTVGQTVFVLLDGRRIPYNNIFSSDLGSLKRLAAEGNAFLGIPKAPSKPHPKTPDFAKFKEIIRDGQAEERKKRDKR